MDTIRRMLAILTWSGLAILLGTMHFQPYLKDCASHAEVISASTDFFYSPWQGCQVEIEPGVWSSWNEMQVRTPQLLDRPACEDRRRTRCV